MANRILSYFRLYGSTAQAKDVAAKAAPVGASAPESNPPFLWSIAQFFCLLIGIFLSPFVTAYQSGKPYSFELSVPLVVFSTVAAILIYPLVFKKSLNTTEPKVIQLFTAFAMGITYQGILSTTAKAISG